MALAVVSGLLLAASFPSLDVEPLAWIGLVPLLFASRGLGIGGAFAIGWLGGLVFYLGTVYWIAYTIVHYTAVPLVAAVGILLIMAAALACYHGAFIAGLRWFDRRRLPTHLARAGALGDPRVAPRLVLHRLSRGRRSATRSTATPTSSRWSR